MARSIPLHLIDPAQPPEDVDIDPLAQSMARVGLLTPILVRRNGERYTLVDGKRRWLAARELGWESISAAVQGEAVTENQAAFRHAGEGRQASPETSDDWPYAGSASLILRIIFGVAAFMVRLLGFVLEVLTWGLRH